MRANLNRMLSDLNAIIAYADAVSVGAKSGCIIHIVKKDPQWSQIYFANDMNTVYGKYVSRVNLEECDIAFRSHLFPSVKSGKMSIEAIREGVRFEWTKKGIEKSVVIPRESEIQSIVDKAFERDFDLKNKVSVSDRLFAAFERNIGVSEIRATPRSIEVSQFKPTGEESHKNIYDFKATAKGWGAMESKGNAKTATVNINTSDFVKITALTGGNDFFISVNQDNPLCVSIQMDDGVLQIMLSHMEYRL